jgi:NTP pyrophosphatase (non-canonical NTP hydrolase)
VRNLDIARLAAISHPVIELFASVEPKPWDRRAILLELVGEIGSLAHQVQHWDGFKSGAPKRSSLADECADVLFVVLRLASEQKIELPSEVVVPECQSQRATDLMLDICGHLSRLIDSDPVETHSVVSLVQSLGTLCGLLGLDLSKAHEIEMRIAMQFFLACGSDWPRPRLIRRPWETMRLWQVLRERRKWNRT